MIRPSVDNVIEVLTARGFRVYDTPGVKWNLNIVGIRNATRDPSLFDDTLCVFHRFMGVWDIAYYPITTDPSAHYLERPVNPKGTAILKSDQYRGVYQIDIHKRGRPGAHRALCQRNGEVTVYRDTNRDRRLDMLPGTEDTGAFGINIHRGPREGQDTERNTIYSAGCQVFADERHFDEFMLKCRSGGGVRKRLHLHPGRRAGLRLSRCRRPARASRVHGGRRRSVGRFHPQPASPAFLANRWTKPGSGRGKIPRAFVFPIYFSGLPLTAIPAVAAPSTILDASCILVPLPHAGLASPAL